MQGKLGSIFMINFIKRMFRTTKPHKSGTDDVGSDDCIIPPTMPISKASEYRAKNDKDAELSIAQYVELEASDEIVLNVELLKSETVLGTKYEMWDVATDKNKWWVITEPTNLYLQEHFQSLDYTLSLHIGLMYRIEERQSKELSKDTSPVDEIIRRFKQAEDRYENAVEAEDYQAVGMSLREALIALIGMLRTRVIFEVNGEPPKGSDFKNWSKILIDTLCAGPKNRLLRKSLRDTSVAAWDLANRVTHNNEANDIETLITLHTCRSITDSLIQLMVLSETSQRTRCPKCQSRNIREYFDPKIGDLGEYYLSCGVCPWSSQPDSET